MKVKITDAMVERAMKSILADNPLSAPDKITRGCFGDTIRKALDAALNPPVEPEIAITSVMAAAGQSVLHKNTEYFAPADHLKLIGGSVQIACDIYRAMRALEPAPTAAIPRLYDIDIDDMRPVTQADVDDLVRVREAFGAWRGGDRALLEVTLAMAQGRCKLGELEKHIRNFKPWEPT